MPYIPEDARVLVEAGAGCENACELSYEITLAIVKYVRRKQLSYQTINDILGALDLTTREFYRRVVVSYEDHKIWRNGDVYPERWH